MLVLTVKLLISELFNRSVSSIYHKGRTIRNRMGGRARGGGGKSGRRTKKSSCKGKLNEEKSHARQETLKNIPVLA